MLIEISDCSVTLQRKRVKNINLRIKRSGEVQVSAPHNMPIDMIQNFLHQKQAWIAEHQQRLLQLHQAVNQDLNTGNYIHFQGIKYKLHVFETQTHQQIQLQDNQIHFYVKPQASRQQKEVLLTKWYRKEMENILPALMTKWQARMGVTIHQMSIKRMKSRWGSCQPQTKHITLNLRLIEKPVCCLEYVIVHELVHLFEASHNQRFYKLMSDYLPNWKEIRKLLR